MTRPATATRRKVLGALFNNTGSFNVAFGFNAGANLTTGSNNIDIGALGVAGESNTMRIGTVKQTATFIVGIRGTATANANAVPVVIDSAGQLGTISSSRRFKDEIRPMDNSSEAILGLKPVTFHYKADKQNTPQFGLIAEEVSKVNPDLVVRDENGEIYTVRYEAVNAMLLNEFLKEHRKVESQEGRLQKQEAVIAQQQKQIEALTATIQKVSAQVEMSKPAPQLVANP
jgi:Chaperone of endosialidase